MIPTASSSPSPAILMARTKSVASIAQPMAARAFQPVLQKNENIGAAGVVIDPANPASFMPRYGRRAKAPGRTPNGAAPTAASSNRPTADRIGSNSAAACRRGIVAGLRQPSRTAIRGGYSLPWRPGDKVDLYRSDDAGATWTIATNDPRPRGRIGGGDLACARHRSQEP